MRAGPIGSMGSLGTRGTLLGLLTATALLYLWDLGASGYADPLYSAAVQAGSESWPAFFFGSLDAGNAVTIGNAPVAVWIMAFSARIFGLSPWSMLVPQALMGVAAVGVLYATVRRVLDRGGRDRGRAHWAALGGAAVFAVTPVSVGAFRWNGPEALLVLLLVLAGYCTVRAVELGSRQWLVGAGVLIGFGFLTGLLPALTVLPAVIVAYVVGAPVGWRRALRDLLAAGAAVLISAGWYVAVVELVPARWRPFVGGSPDGSLLGLIGSPRATGGVAEGTAESWSGALVAWLLPAAVILTIFALGWTRSAIQRAGLVLFGGWLLVAGVAGQPAVLPPAIGGAVGLGVAILWSARGSLPARIGLSAAVGATAVWAVVLSSRAAGAYPVLGWVAGILGGLAALTLLVGDRLAKVSAVAVLVGAVLAGLAGPAAYSLVTAAIPRAGGGAVAGAVIGGNELDLALLDGASRYDWVAATVGARSAARLQLGSGYPVLAVGGLDGSDPTPTLAEFEEMVRQGRIHYFVTGSGDQVPDASGPALEIQTWVSANFPAQTIGGNTVHDLADASQ
ncbi:ArnT family glycosyltransferase [Enemella evansiae]|uniref:ArnT family glycosyltransferase n=1 Tax=Enemella evansiae TaxID=2016499 RepID=UPI001E3D2651|nr:glycosyltransferase family 39 protein [Enemella evansiae]